MDIQSKLLKCSRTFTDLYQLNARIGGIEDPDIPHSRKLNAAVCVIKPFLKHFGTFDKADTTSYESIHRVMTVALWHKTSKRYESMYSEMSRQTVLLNYSNLNNFLSAYYKNDLGAYCMEKGPESYPEHVVIHWNHLKLQSLPDTGYDGKRIGMCGTRRDPIRLVELFYRVLTFTRTFTTK